MFELLIVLGLVGGLAGATAFITMSSWQFVFGLGLVLIAGGMLLSIPTGFWYHVKLWRALSPRGALPPRWWLSPTSHHKKLTDAERPPVMRWFTWGAIGFGIAMLGCALVMAGALRSG